MFVAEQRMHINAVGQYAFTEGACLLVRLEWELYLGAQYLIWKI